MIKQGFIIDAGKFEFVRDCQYDDKLTKGMFVKVNGDLLPAAYVYPIENKQRVLDLMKACKDSKTAHDNLVADVFYKQLHKLR